MYKAADVTLQIAGVFGYFLAIYYTDGICGAILGDLGLWGAVGFEGPYLTNVD
ncbi:hypothetical protein MSWAN_0078 [Methanobacterium paludis]|uniref:Uncharacterized protein n=1 Tax=Methanobacterium paludis (strain DSM 25820 / JCM 18151 / SWAN1) TaxID=868131 RepID=F6D7P6_METPW|nr:hypothetical protein MSWAN_0078 [Methanobacterium paludis]